MGLRSIVILGKKEQEKNPLVTILLTWLRNLDSKYSIDVNALSFHRAMAGGTAPLPTSTFPAPLTEKDSKYIRQLRKNNSARVAFSKQFCDTIYYCYCMELRKLDKTDRTIPELASELTVIYFSNFFKNKQYENINCTIRHYLFLDVQRNIVAHLREIKNNSLTGDAETF